MTEITVLLIEDSFYSADLNMREIKKADFAVRSHQVASGSDSMRNAMREAKWDLIISDNSMPNFSALEALEIRNCENRNIPFIIVSEDIQEKDIAKAFEEGCSAFVSKEELQELRRVVREILGSEARG